VSISAVNSAPRRHYKVAVEGKLFSIGAECDTTGSNDFYLAFAATRKIMLWPFRGESWACSAAIADHG
jgi:L-rhamnose isomerase